MSTERLLTKTASYRWFHTKTYRARAGSVGHKFMSLWKEETPEVIKKKCAKAAALYWYLRGRSDARHRWLEHIHRLADKEETDEIN